jgi:hypothetical protein
MGGYMVDIYIYGFMGSYFDFYGRYNELISIHGGLQWFIDQLITPGPIL